MIILNSLKYFSFLNSVPEDKTAYWQDGCVTSFNKNSLDPKSESHGDSNNSSCICILPFNTIVGRAYKCFLWLSGAQFLNIDMKVSF